MDKNKDGVVTLEEFVVACQEVGVTGHLISPLLQNHCLHAVFNSQSHLQLFAVSRLRSTLMYTFIFPTGWNHDEIHATLWKCDVGWRVGQRRQRNLRGLGVSVCMWRVHGCSGRSSCSRLIWLWHRHSKDDVRTVGSIHKPVDWRCRRGLYTHFLAGDKTAWKLCVS